MKNRLICQECGQKHSFYRDSNLLHCKYCGAELSPHDVFGLSMHIRKRNKTLASMVRNLIKYKLKENKDDHKV